MKDAYYFSHDSNAKDDPKCVLLIEQLGLEGYGIFWVLIETLRDQPDYKYPLQLIPALSRRFNTTIEKMKTVIFNYGLFKIDGNEFFFSDSLMKRMIDVNLSRISGIKGSLIRHGYISREDADLMNDNEILNVHNNIKDLAPTYPPTNTLLPRKKKKEKENKENNIIVEEIYKSYPSKCHSGRSTGKTSKNKDKISTLLKKYSADHLKKVIDWYLNDCSKNNTYLKNFGTFLNNIPDIEEDKQKNNEDRYRFKFKGTGHVFEGTESEFKAKYPTMILHEDYEYKRI